MNAFLSLLVYLNYLIISVLCTQPELHRWPYDPQAKKVPLLQRAFAWQGSEAMTKWKRNRELQIVLSSYRPISTTSFTESPSPFRIADLCYEGCFSAPSSDPWANALPHMLERGVRGTPMPLLKCSYLAWSAGLSHFAIMDEIDCYGGNRTVVGWPQEWECLMQCVPGGEYPFSCGGNRQASVFSMGYCEMDTSPCQTNLPLMPSPSLPRSPSLPGLPPSPPRLSPSPSPAAPRIFRCRDDNVSLWGQELPRVKLDLKNSPTVNTELCQRLCAANPACAGLYFKKDNYCHQFSCVDSFTSKHYPSIVRACKKLVRRTCT